MNQEDTYRLFERATQHLARLVSNRRAESGPRLNEARYKALIEAAHDLGFRLEALEPDYRVPLPGHRIINEVGNRLATLRYSVAGGFPELMDFDLLRMQPVLRIERDDNAWQVAADKLLWPQPPHPAQVWHALWELPAAQATLNWDTVPAPEVQLYADHRAAEWRWRVTLRREKGKA